MCMYNFICIFVLLIISNNIQTYKKMKTIEITIQEIWAATRPIVQKSKKSYTRKRKHKNVD